jgi:hypothetical protein
VVGLGLLPVLFSRVAEQPSKKIQEFLRFVAGHVVIGTFAALAV